MNITGFDVNHRGHGNIFVMNYLAMRGVPLERHVRLLHRLKYFNMASCFSTFESSNFTMS
jgi:hypothetical protein